MTAYWCELASRLDPELYLAMSALVIDEISPLVTNHAEFGALVLAPNASCSEDAALGLCAMPPKGKMAIVARRGRVGFRRHRPMVGLYSVIRLEPEGQQSRSISSRATDTHAASVG
jgi:hypothetical protein